MNKIKILYQSSIPHIKMGGQKSLLALIDNLDFDKYEPEVIVPEVGQLSIALEKRGIKFHLARIPAFKLNKILKLLNSYFKLKKLIKNNGYKVIHSDHDKFMLFVSFITKDVKTVYHARVVHSHKYDKFLQERLDAIIGISDGVLKRFNKNKNPDKLHKIYNGVDCNLFTPISDRAALKKKLDLDSYKFNVLFVGQMKKGKGIFELVKAAKKLKIENVSFNFVGDFLNESTKKEWLEYKEKNGLNQVKWLGQKKDIYEWMQASDTLILPSHEGVEGMGRVLFESMACGTPTIASNTSGVKEALTLETGILFGEKSVDELVDAILVLKNNKERWQRMSLASRERAVNVFDIKIHAKKVMYLYKELLDE